MRIKKLDYSDQGRSFFLILIFPGASFVTRVFARVGMCVCTPIHT